MKNCLLILTILFIIACQPDKEPEPIYNSWRQLKDFPSEGRSDRTTIAFSLLGKGYYGMGGNETTLHFRDIWCYDAAKDSWEQKSDYPYDLRPEVSLSMNDRGYVMTYSGNLYEYEPVEDSWKYISSLPATIRTGITGFALDGHVYFGSGNIVDNEGGTLSNDFWKYDPLENKWAQIKDFPGVARMDAKSFVIGDKAYVGLGFGGSSAPPFHTDMWSYDAIKNEWAQIADFPSSSISGIVFSSTTKGYIGVDRDNLHTHCNVYEYNPETDRWVEVQRFPSRSFINTKSFTINHRLFVVGGFWSEPSKHLWEYIPALSD